MVGGALAYGAGLDLPMPPRYLRAFGLGSSALNALSLRILGTGRHVPATEVTSHALDERWQLPAGTTFARLGMETRHYVGEGETASSMGAVAAQQALDSAGLDASQIDCLISACSVDTHDSLAHAALSRVVQWVLSCAVSRVRCRSPS
ncbi:hypothetical protein ADT25_08960 [Xanthomonas oryzae]|uniref:Beta-ketoacyl-[acyl-carrier-protein] synthase III N-terminal domain-containing protein n=1 Tax=Xanthomonas oryzae TaxID=347 RepID=A0AAP0ZLM0_9XANT|nr:hypothetical protein ADT25_08960 [Xanthomonas oryzae]